MKKIIATGAFTVSLLAVSVVAHAAGTPMPDFSEKGLTTVYSALGDGTTVDVTDASGQGRSVQWPADWKVCDQTPAPGAEVTDHVTVTAVKKTETCPTRTGR